MRLRWNATRPSTRPAASWRSSSPRRAASPRPTRSTGPACEHNPRDEAALVGLGRSAFQQGDIEAATRHFEEALEANPRQPEALKELAQIDLRRGRYRDACSRLELLTQIEPFDADIRYSFAQALRLVGDNTRFRAESERATRLRKDNERIDELRNALLRQPGDVDARFEVARWMLEHGHQAEALDWTAVILPRLAEPRPHASPARGSLPAEGQRGAGELPPDDGGIRSGQRHGGPGREAGALIEVSICEV